LQLTDEFQRHDSSQVAVNQHLNRVKIITDPLCQACSEEVETSYHLFPCEISS